MPRELSPYYVMNAALREKNRQAVRPWRDFVWLLLHALRKLPPSKARVVYRGMAGSVLAEGAELQWSAFSSTATKVDVMEDFLDTEVATSEGGAGVGWTRLDSEGSVVLTGPSWALSGPGASISGSSSSSSELSV